MTAPTSAIIQKRNAEMTALVSADLLSVDDKNAATELYSNAGGQVFTLASPITVTLDTQIITSFPEVFEMDSNALTILEYGLYHFYASAQVVQNGGSASAALVAWVEEDPDTGVWAIVPQSEAYFTMAPITQARCGTQIIFTRFSSPNYKYRLRVTQQAGSSSLATIGSFCKLGCVRLFKMG